VAGGLPLTRFASTSVLAPVKDRPALLASLLSAAVVAHERWPSHPPQLISQHAIGNFFLIYI
jgi:hypothetical protein